MVAFTVLGQPMGKGRPQFSTYSGHIVARTPTKTVEYENLVRMSYVSEYGEYMFPQETPLAVHMKAYYAIPKSASKKKRLAMLNGSLRPTKKPDVDNIAKAVLDSLNHLAYHDDSQVVELAFQKFYGECPRVEVLIQSI